MKAIPWKVVVRCQQWSTSLFEMLNILGFTRKNDERIHKEFTNNELKTENLIRTHTHTYTWVYNTILVNFLIMLFSIRASLWCGAIWYRSISFVYYYNINYMLMIVFEILRHVLSKIFQIRVENQFWTEDKKSKKKTRKQKSQQEMNTYFEWILENSKQTVRMHD